MSGLALATLLALPLWLAGCGNVGPPIAPESIGVAAKMKREQMKREEQLKKEQEKAAAGEPEREVPPEEMPVEEEPLPEFRPIGAAR